VRASGEAEAVRGDRGQTEKARMTRALPKTPPLFYFFFDPFAGFFVAMRSPLLFTEMETPVV
jgi:hypothetical protein